MKATPILYLMLTLSNLLFSQNPLPDHPTEVLYAYEDFETKKLQAQFKTNYRYDLLGNIIYEGNNRVAQLDTTGPYWVLDTEVWYRYDASGRLQNRFLQRNQPNRSTAESHYDDAGNVVRATTNRYAFETDEWVQGTLTESNFQQNRLVESITSSLDLPNGTYQPSFRRINLHDEKGRISSEYAFVWNLSIGNWDTTSRTRYRYEIGLDSTIMKESAQYDPQLGDWTVNNQILQTFDSADRILLEVYGLETFGLYRTIYTYDDQAGIHTIFSEGQFPGDTVWTPFSQQELSYEDELLVRSINRNTWDSTRMAFQSSFTRNISYRDDRRIDQVVQIFNRYIPSSGQTFRSEETTQYAYEFYCDDKLRYEQARPTFVGAPIQFRTTYAYAEPPDCAANDAPVSVRAYPNPVTNRDPFLRVESAWLSSPGVRGEVIDLLGRRHQTFTGQQGWAIDLPVQALQPGHYFIHLYKDGEKRSTKFIKEE